MAIQNSMNQLVGTLSTVSAIGKHLENQEKQAKATEDNTNQLSTLQKQVADLNSPDYGRTMTNAEAEAKSIASLMNALYPGNKMKNIRDSYSATQKADVEGLERSHQLALEKWKQAALEYNYPGGTQMNRTLSSDPEEEAVNNG